MQLQTAKRLRNAARRLGIEASVREGYSGRGMYGRTTAALTLARIGELAACAAAARVPRAEREEFALELSRLSQDSMGFGIIVY